MNDISLIINIIIRGITTVIFIMVLLPLFIKEARVKNGLKTLRLELLFTGLTICIVNVAGLMMILFKFFYEDIVIIQTIISYVSTIGFLAYSLLLLRIYTRKYTPEQKELHRRFENMEIAAEKSRQKRELP